MCRWPNKRVIEMPHSPSKLYTPRKYVAYQCSDDTACCGTPDKTCVAKRSEELILWFQVRYVSNDFAGICLVPPNFDWHLSGRRKRLITEWWWIDRWNSFSTCWKSKPISNEKGKREKRKGQWGWLHMIHLNPVLNLTQCVFICSGRRSEQRNLKKLEFSKEWGRF